MQLLQPRCSAGIVDAVAFAFAFAVARGVVVAAVAGADPDALVTESQVQRRCSRSCNAAIAVRVQRW